MPYVFWAKTSFTMLLVQTWRTLAQANVLVEIRLRGYDSILEIFERTTWEGSHLARLTFRTRF